MKVKRKFYRAVMKSKELGVRYVTANFYEYGGDAENKEDANWLSFTEDFVEATVEIEPEDFSSDRDTKLES